jgi:tRNA threonylcarbamoyladenosine biosynthesis protein TsaE
MTRSAADTEKLAGRLGKMVRAGDTIGLRGPLGAGKTCFVRGLARGLGVPAAAIQSPSFVLCQEHASGRVPLYHVDLFRVAAAAELRELPLAELVDGDGVCTIEWIDRFPEVAPSEWLEVQLEPVSVGGRRVIARGVGARGRALLVEWLRRASGRRTRKRAKSGRARRG